MSYSLSQLDAIGDVDPVAEADVYLAYGRDLQAEEILKEAMRATPDRMAIRTKLLEVYAKRRDSQGYKQLPRIVQPLLDAGYIDQAAYDGWVGAANGMYAANTQIQHDEAIRSASLAGMTLMLAATAKGFASCPMVGFDPAAVAKEFGLKDGEIPVMIITVGKAAEGNWGRKARLPVAEKLQVA